MANELDSLDFLIVTCMGCGSLDEAYEPNDAHLCADCEDATYFCPYCMEVGNDCTCTDYCQYCSNDEEYCDCLTCDDCGTIVYECGCEEDYPFRNNDDLLITDDG